MNCTVKARPTIFKFGCSTWKPSSYWLWYATPPRPPPPPPPVPPNWFKPAQTSSADMPRARSIRLSATLGLPSANRSAWYCEVSSVICSLVSVYSCARAGTGNQMAAADTAARVSNRRFVIWSAPLPVVAPVHIPLRSGFEESRLQKVLLDHIFVERDAEAGLVGDGDEAFVDDRLLHSFHQIAPPGHVHRVVFHDQKVLGSGGAMHVGHAGNRRAGEMHGHRHAMFLGAIADLLGLQNAARSCQVRMDNVHRVAAAQLHERLFDKDIFPGKQGHFDVFVDLLQQLGALPGHHVFEPCRIVFLQRLGQPDAGAHADVAEVVHGERYLHAHLFADGGHEIGHQLSALVRDFDAGEHVLGAPASGEVFARRIGEGARHILDEVDSQIHLQPGEALLLAQAQPLSVDLRVVRFGGVGVASDAVAELAAEHLVHGYVVDLAGDIPHRHFDGADAAALPRRAAELLDPAENLVHVAGVFIEDAAFQHERVVLAGAIAHFAQAIDALVGIDADDGARHGRAADGEHPQVRDLQSRGLGIRIDVLRESIEGLVRPETGAQRSADAFKE